ncbi:hypothetical protein OE88DRAFT_1657662 [Heliocybe sulcata]|uniref:Uncharacterized protein n=1 Tax=Heliocybe sulcata TaxID=5364 RepID=A0A5C3N7F2_9AGAM|nr:hypothetical protein OE88DRAFT_1657662 [Heliocybe sulcata]
MLFSWTISYRSYCVIIAEEIPPEQRTRKQSPVMGLGRRWTEQTTPFSACSSSSLGREQASGRIDRPLKIAERRRSTSILAAYARCSQTRPYHRHLSLVVVHP